MVGRDVVFLVTCVEVKALDHLVGVVHAGDTVGLGLGLCQCRQQQAGKDGNDGYHHQQLDEGKSGVIS